MTRPVTVTGFRRTNSGVQPPDAPKPPHRDELESWWPSNLEVTKASLLIFVISVIVAIVTTVKALHLPEPMSRPDVAMAPQQTAVPYEDRDPFSIQSRGHTYTLTPRFLYRLSGLVVEKSDAMGWKNTTHKAVGDFINTNDLCLVWGPNAETLDLGNFAFTHGDWTCYVSTRSSDAWQEFKQDGLSNNHVIPATPELAEQIRSIRIGDQVEIQGQLVDYSIDGNPPRTTSTIRTDTGNGACEIIYVTGFRILKRHQQRMYHWAEFAVRTGGLSLFVFFFSLFVLPFIRKSY